MDMLGIFRQFTLPCRCYLICGGEDFSLQVYTVSLIYWAATSGRQSDSGHECGSVPVAAVRLNP
jgi:hypothetical protein